MRLTELSGNNEIKSRQSPRNNTKGASRRAARVASAGEDVSICEPSQACCRPSTKSLAGGANGASQPFALRIYRRSSEFLRTPWMSCRLPVGRQQKLVDPLIGTSRPHFQAILATRLGAETHVARACRLSWHTLRCCGYQVLGTYGLFSVTPLPSTGSHDIRHRCQRSSISGRSSSLWPS